MKKWRDHFCAKSPFKYKPERENRWNRTEKWKEDGKRVKIKGKTDDFDNEGTIKIKEKGKKRTKYKYSSAKEKIKYLEDNSVPLNPKEKEMKRKMVNSGDWGR